MYYRTSSIIKAGRWQVCLFNNCNMHVGGGNMKIRLLLFPYYVTPESARTFSPVFFAELDRLGVEIKPEWWNGMLEGIKPSPSDKPTIVRASSQMKCDETELALRCEKLGFFLFYNDLWLFSVGRPVGGEEMVEGFRMWVRRKIEA